MTSLNINQKPILPHGVNWVILIHPIYPTSEMIIFTKSQYELRVKENYKKSPKLPHPTLVDEVTQVFLESNNAR